MEEIKTPTGNKNGDSSALRRSERKQSNPREEEIGGSTGIKRKRNSTGPNMASKNKKANSECTNAQLMSTLDKLAEKNGAIAQ